MEENNEEKKVNTEEIKKETVDTVNQVKDTIKNVNIKEDTKVATGFVSKMFKDPFGTIQEIAKDSEHKHLKTAIVFIVVWMLIIFVKAIFTRYWSASHVFKTVLSIVKSTIAPAIGIIVLSAIIYFMNKNAKKSLSTIITGITVAKVPKIIAAAIGLLTIISSNASMITSPISSLCSVISTVLTYFTMKALFEEKENSKFLKTFVIVEAIYYIAYFVLSFLGIYI